MIEDLLWREMVAKGRLGETIIRFREEVSSTNDLALQLGREGAAGFTVVVAERQKQGRGRLGRQWMSPPGVGIYCSIILRPELEVADLPKITITAGLAVSKAVEESTSLFPAIKWPNDLTLGGRKFCGILAETGDISQSGPPLVILGVGLNVNLPGTGLPKELREKATSLEECSGRCFLRSELLRAIIKEIKEKVRLLQRGGFNKILVEWRQRDATIGRELTWVCRNNHIVSGVSLGPDEHGVLKIQDSQGNIHEVISGDVNIVAG